jgi:protein TonB
MRMNPTQGDAGRRRLNWQAYGAALAASLLIHALFWQTWQALHHEPAPQATPAKVLEVALVTLPPPPVQTPPKAQAPTPPPAPPKPKPPEKPKPKPAPPKPKPPPKPTPVLQESAPAPEPAREAAPAPAQAPPQPKPTPPAPVFEAAKYNSASLSNPRTRYPRMAQERGWEGTVLLKVQVLPSGEAGEVSVARSSEHETLDEAAVEQVKEWRFEPARRDGKPVASVISIPITFKLKK